MILNHLFGDELRKILSVVLASSLTSCSYTTPEQRGVKIDDTIYKLYNQDKAMLTLESMVGDHYGVITGDLFADARVYWATTRCPYQDQYAVIYTPPSQSAPKCYHGVMFGCDEIYVAVAELDAGKTCGTALLHEFGHCLYLDLFGSADGGHEDDAFWQLAGNAAAIACERGW